MFIIHCLILHAHTPNNLHYPRVITNPHINGVMSDLHSMVTVMIPNSPAVKAWRRGPGQTCPHQILRAPSRPSLLM
jgi:hypothetical protein